MRHDPFIQLRERRQHRRLREGGGRQLAQGVI
jgi:hypothetical protein